MENEDELNQKEKVMTNNPGQPKKQSMMTVLATIKAKEKKKLMRNLAELGELLKQHPQKK
ncbi:MAG: hypothetical protein ABSG89_02005 [Bacteroidales bacterium]